MDKFERLLDQLAPKLKAIAGKYAAKEAFTGAEDLYQEMCINLWEKFPQGLPEGINQAYAVKGCKFHLLNYLRTKREKIRPVSLDEPFSPAGETLKDKLPDVSWAGRDLLDKNIAVKEILNNGFTVREKQVFSLCLSGYTVREIGTRLNISHVRVVKLKKNLIARWRKKDKE